MFFQKKSPLLKALRARHIKAPDPGEPGAVKKGDWKTFHIEEKGSFVMVNYYYIYLPLTVNPLYVFFSTIYIKLHELFANISIYAILIQ